MNIGNGITTGLAGMKAVQLQQDLKNVDKKLRGSYILKQAGNSLKTGAKDTLILTAGAAGTAAATGVAAKAVASKFDFKSLAAKFKPSEIKATLNNMKEKCTAENLKDAFKNVKEKLTPENIKNASKKIGTFASTSKNKIQGLIKNPKSIVTAGKEKISDILGKFKGATAKDTLKNGINKIKNLPGPAKAILGAGAALTALFVINNNKKGAYKAGQINQQYVDMSNSLNSYK